jgi:integrase/recombinase XerD
MIPTDLATHLTAYLGGYLPGQRNVSTNTIRSYRDTFSLLLAYCRDVRGLALERLTLQILSSSLIEEFLAWLEEIRGNCVTTRNQRLAAIHAFFRYLQQEEPGMLLFCQRILVIPFKRQACAPVSHLTAEAIQALLAQPNQNVASGRRDLTLLCTLYDTGARVQELVDLSVKDVRLDAPAVIRLTGKGRKARHVPLMTRTVALLDSYLEEWRLTAPDKMDRPLFFNRQHHKLTRAGVTYMLQKYVEQARFQQPGFPEHVTPHVLRHSKAMHLLQAGVNLIYIRDILGHVDIKTTEIYARADTEMKRQALAQLPPPPGPTNRPSWSEDNQLLTWLRSL